MADNDNDGPSQQPPEDSDAQPDEILVSCRCESAKTLATLLQCLRHSSSDETRRSTSAIQPVTVFCTQKSISFHVHGKAKQIQSSVDIQPSFFSDYHLGGDSNTNNHANDDAFCVNLTTLLDCLHALGTSQSLAQTKVSLAYNTTTQVLKLELCGHQALTVAAIPGMDMDHDDEDATPLSLAFRSSATTVRMILQSAVLQHVWTELQHVTGATTGTLSMGKERGLELRVVGSLHACGITIPAVGSHMVALEVAPNTTTVTREYPLSSLKESMRGLEIAEETCITMNSAGMVAIQHIVFDKALSEDPCFVDYIFCCRQEESDDEEDEASRMTRLQERDDELSRGTIIQASQTTITTSTQLFPANSSPSSTHQDDTTLSTRSRKKSRIVVSDSKPEDDVPASDTSSSRRLFAPPPSRGSMPVTTNRRRRRHNNSNSNNDDPTASDGSVNLLQDTDNDAASSSSSDESEIAASPPARNRSSSEQGGCSSPELVYGRQD